MLLKRLNISTLKTCKYFTGLRPLKLFFYAVGILILLTIRILFFYPQIVEIYYSNGLYPYIATTFRFLFGWLPFSFGDILYTFFGVFGLIFLIRKRRIIWKRPLFFLFRITVLLFVGYILFYGFWALNYYRMPLYKTLNLESTYTTQQLEVFSEKMIEKSNELNYRITKNDTVEVQIPYSKKQIFNKVAQGYDTLSIDFPELRNRYMPMSLKKSLYSLALTYMGYSGYFNPFTGEAQVNSLAPNFHFPITSCHEVAHQIGYSAENEANFIAYLAAVSNEDIYFKYAAYTFALRYTLSEVRKRDPEGYRRLYKKVSKGILKGYRRQIEFWKSYENNMEPIIKKTYNAYLKANNQEKGIQSYNYVVALLVNYYKKIHSL